MKAPPLPVRKPRCGRWMADPTSWSSRRKFPSDCL